MKKFVYIFLIILSVFCFVGCQNNFQNETRDIPSVEVGDFEMKIDGKAIDITWEENDSVNDLLSFAENGIEISMSRYGGFEQVGSIGKKIVSSDKKITTNPGDVVLYSSNQIVIFFGSNTWSYTKLGHINLSKAELESLLDKSSVKLSLGKTAKED